MFPGFFFLSSDADWGYILKNKHIQWITGNVLLVYSWLALHTEVPFRMVNGFGQCAVQGVNWCLAWSLALSRASSSSSERFSSSLPVWLAAGGPSWASSSATWNTHTHTHNEYILNIKTNVYSAFQCTQVNKTKSYSHTNVSVSEMLVEC